MQNHVTRQAPCREETSSQKECWAQIAVGNLVLTEAGVASSEAGVSWTHLEFRSLMDRGTEPTLEVTQCKARLNHKWRNSLHALSCGRYLND
jgi:hypothetical protein